jgi:hypothetical protein
MGSQRRLDLGESISEQPADELILMDLFKYYKVRCVHLRRLVFTAVTTHVLTGIGTEAQLAKDKP